MIGMWTAVVLGQLPVVVTAPAPPGAVCCVACGARTAAVLFEVRKLETFPDRKARDHAAKALRRYNWRCHPEAVAALVHALLNDGDGEVREEAAESLAKMAPCLPEAHAALQRAAGCDPRHAVRKWARRGLRALGRRCEGDCSACGPPAAPPVVIPGPPAVVEEPALRPESVVPPGGGGASPLAPADPTATPGDPAAPPLVPPSDLPAPLPEVKPPPADPPAAATRSSDAKSRRLFRPLSLLLGRRRAGR